MVIESMAMAVFREAVGLLSLAGLPVASLRFPVNPESPLAATLLRTVCLAPPAPAADKEPHAAEAAVNLDKKQSGLQPCTQSEAVVKRMSCLGLPIVSGALFQSPKLPLRAFLFLSFQLFGESTKKPFLGRARCGQNGERFYRWVNLVSGWVILRERLTRGQVGQEW